MTHTRSAKQTPCTRLSRKKQSQDRDGSRQLAVASWLNGITRCRFEGEGFLEQIGLLTPNDPRQRGGRRRECANHVEREALGLQWPRLDLARTERFDASPSRRFHPSFGGGGTWCLHIGDCHGVLMSKYATLKVPARILNLCSSICPRCRDKQRQPTGI